MKKLTIPPASSHLFAFLFGLSISGILTVCTGDDTEIKGASNLEDRVLALEGQVATLQGQVTTLEGQQASVQTLLASVSLDGSGDLVLTGVNLRIEDGLGGSRCEPSDPTYPPCNGKGNLVIGYDEATVTVGDDKSGSHNLVIGGEHTYTSYGGIVAGFNNAIMDRHAKVLGGSNNTASGASSLILRGGNNVASGIGSIVLNGSTNVASNSGSMVLNGTNNQATGSNTTVLGGQGCIAPNPQGVYVGDDIAPGACLPPLN